jgi:hypothetical protein
MGFLHISPSVRGTKKTGQSQPDALALTPRKSLALAVSPSGKATETNHHRPRTRVRSLSTRQSTSSILVIPPFANARRMGTQDCSPGELLSEVCSQLLSFRGTMLICLRSLPEEGVRAFTPPTKHPSCRWKVQVLDGKASVSTRNCVP